MARKTPPPSPQPAQLSADQMRIAIPKLRRRIEELATFDPNSITDRSDPRPDAIEKKIDDSLVEILGPDTLDYRRFRVGSLDRGPIIMGGTPIHEARKGYERGKADALSKLQTLIEIFEEKLADSEQGLSPASTSFQPRLQTAGADTMKAFVVHGQDEATREAIARFLERLHIEPVILHEQANEGRTVIEKLEYYGDVRFAVVLLTPDDEGRKAKPEEPLRPRARQNVLLELGYFVGKLGRSRVCALHRGALEIPTDYLGVLYVPFDESGGWQLRLAKELKAAGFDIDMNKAI